MLLLSKPQPPLSVNCLLKFPTLSKNCRPSSLIPCFFLSLTLPSQPTNSNIALFGRCRARLSAYTPDPLWKIFFVNSRLVSSWKSRYAALHSRVPPPLYPEIFFNDPPYKANAFPLNLPSSPSTAPLPCSTEPPREIDIANGIFGRNPNFFFLPFVLVLGSCKFVNSPDSHSLVYFCSPLSPPWGLTFSLPLFRHLFRFR